MSDLPLGAVERELARLWSASPRSDVHSVSLDLVAFCATAEELPRVRAALAVVAASHPVRSIAVACRPGETAAITARVALHANAARGGEPCGEAIELDVRGGAREWVPATLEGLRVPDLPVCLWWVGDLPDDDTLYDRLVEHADVVVVHSAEMDLRDLQKLSDLATWAAGAYALRDINWARIGAWQEFMARFFDDPAARAQLPALDALTVEFSPRDGVGEPVSTQAALFGAWLAARLGWDPATTAPRWTASSRGREVALDLANGRTLAVRFVPDPRAGVWPGALTRCVLESREASFAVERAPDEPLVLCWKGEAPGVLVPAQCVRIRAPDEPRLLARVLEHPTRDELYERSLAAAAALVAPVAPAAPSAEGG